MSEPDSDPRHLDDLDEAILNLDRETLRERLPGLVLVPDLDAVDFGCFSRLAAGEPIFRAVNNRHQISAERLTAHSVSRIAKRAARDIARKRGKTMEEAKAVIQRFSGHSLRAGFVTSAAAADVPPLRIAQHTRHKSLEMVNRYCREADKYSRSALKGIFRAAPEEGVHDP
jgi:integrase